MNLSGLDYGLLFVFKICAEEKSFSKASKILNVKQPAISYDIKKLEELLNVQLFNRNNSGITLTNEGQVLYDYVQEANNHLTSGLNVIDELKSKEIKRIRVGLAVSIGSTYISPVIKEFKKIFPKVEIYLYSNPEEQMLLDLKEKNLDIVIYTSSRNTSMNGIKIKKIQNSEIVLVGNKDMKKIYDSGDKEVIHKMPMIFPDPKSKIGKILSQEMAINKMDGLMYCQSSIIAKQMIIDGLGIGYINKYIVDKDIKDGKIYILDYFDNPGTYSIDIAVQEKNNNVAVDEFIKIFIKSVVD